MLDQTGLEENLHRLIVDICRVMYDNGYESLSVGAVMRLIGVGEERASQHDTEFIDLAEYFTKTAAQERPVARTNQEGQTLH